MIYVKNKINIFISAITLMFLSQSVHAAISLDRTRAIFFESDGGLTISISNENKKLPYLAQVWVENEKQEKITTGPIVVTPPPSAVRTSEKKYGFYFFDTRYKKITSGQRIFILF